MARSRTALSPAVTERIVEVVRAGNYVGVAAQAAGIHRATYYSWMRRGEEASEARGRGEPLSPDDVPFADFFDQVIEAEALAEIDAVAAVREAKGGWQAHMTYLERRFSERWRRMDGTRVGRQEQREESFEQALARLEKEPAA